MMEQLISMTYKTDSYLMNYVSQGGIFSTNRKLSFGVFVVVIVHSVDVKVYFCVSEEHASAFMTEVHMVSK
jgi:hypothetical protein